MSKIFYISNLEQTKDWSALETLFTTVGDVESFRMETHQASTLSFGVVEMATDLQAFNCIERFNGKVAVGQRLSISPNKPKPPRRKI